MLKWVNLATFSQKLALLKMAQTRVFDHVLAFQKSLELQGSTVESTKRPWALLETQTLQSSSILSCDLLPWCMENSLIYLHIQLQMLASTWHGVNIRDKLCPSGKGIASLVPLTFYWRPPNPLVPTRSLQGAGRNQVSGGQVQGGIKGMMESFCSHMPGSIIGKGHWEW